MANSTEDTQRWKTFHYELCARVMFHPSSLLYYTHMANNRLYKKLHNAAQELSLSFKYAKYYFLDLSAQPEGKPYSSSEQYSFESTIEEIKNTEYTAGRLPVSRETAIRKINNAINAFNTVLTTQSRLVGGVEAPLRYPKDCFKACEIYAQDRFGSDTELQKLANAIKCRAAKSRVLVSEKGTNATFTVDGKTVTSFLGGDAVSPKMLGIELGDIVNENYSYVVTSIGDLSFTVKESGLVSVQSILSPMGVVDGFSLLFKAYLQTFRPISTAPVQNASEFKQRLQNMLDSIRDISFDLTPPEYTSLGLEIADCKNLLSTVSRETVGFTKAQRDFAIKTLDLAKNRGFDMIEFMLRNYRIKEALGYNNDQRSLDEIGVEAGSSMSTFVANTKRSL